MTSSSGLGRLSKSDKEAIVIWARLRVTPHLRRVEPWRLVRRGKGVSRATVPAETLAEYTREKIESGPNKRSGS